MISRISNLNKSLIQSNQSGALVNEMIELQTIHDEFKNNNLLINSLFEIKRLFEKHQQRINIDEEYPLKLAENISKIEDNFIRDQSVDSIKKGSRFYADYKSNINEFVKNFKQKIKNEWENFCNQVYKGDDYGFLITNFNTHENENILNNLKPLFDEFNIIKQSTDYNDEKFTKLISIGYKLTKESTRLKRDFSEDVQKFLNAIQNDEATLDLYTEDVIKWVKETNSLVRYKIKKNDN